MNCIYLTKDRIKLKLINLNVKFYFRILIDNPHLYHLYNDLVVGSIIAADTFWNNFVDVSTLI